MSFETRDPRDPDSLSDHPDDAPTSPSLLPRSPKVPPPLPSGKGKSVDKTQDITYKAILGLLKTPVNQQAEASLLATLEDRFAANLQRHPVIKWHTFYAKLESRKDRNQKLSVLHKMSITGGAPDVFRYIQKTDEYLVADSSSESPAGRRNLSYDQALQVSASMGTAIFTYDQYQHIFQGLGFDLHSSNWALTPKEERANGYVFVADGDPLAGFPGYNPRERDTNLRAQTRGFRGWVVI